MAGMSAVPPSPPPLPELPEKEARAPKTATASPQTPTATRPRPRWLRALGHDDPPAEFEADGRRYRRVTIFKHDAFAATALYAAADHPAQRVLGKFARRQSAFGVPMGWLGWWFHRREQRVYERMADHPLVPDTLGDVTVNGKTWPAAAARVFVEGHPLEEGERPHDGFFPTLEKLIEAFHARRVAVVDLHKRDNILVGDDGEPYLMDFQISLAPPGSSHSGPGSFWDRAASRWFDFRGWFDFRAWLFRPACRADRYHFMKHWVRHRPDQLTEVQRDLDQYRPLGVRLWRRGIRPIHVARRKLFVALRFRTGKGDPETEVAPDVRPEDVTPGPSPDDTTANRPAPELPA